MCLQHYYFIYFLLSSILGTNYLSKPGLWGGKVSSMDLKVNVTQEMNGIVYTCQSTNEALQRSVHEAITLQVLCTYIYR
jgi:nephron